MTAVFAKKQGLSRWSCLKEGFMGQDHEGPWCHHIDAIGHITELRSLIEEGHLLLADSISVVEKQSMLLDSAQYKIALLNQEIHELRLINERLRIEGK
jgi:hypothetical protein